MESTSSSGGKATVRLTKAFEEVCNTVTSRLDSEFEYGNSDAILVLARELNKRPKAAVDELAKLWEQELEFKVELEVIEAAIALNALLGSDWPVFLHAYQLGQDEIFYARTTPDFRLREARSTLDDEFAEFDAKRAKEEKAARAWMKRHVKKAA